MEDKLMLKNHEIVVFYDVKDKKLDFPGGYRFSFADAELELVNYIRRNPVKGWYWYIKKYYATQHKFSGPPTVTVGPPYFGSLRVILSIKELGLQRTMVYQEVWLKSQSILVHRWRSEKTKSV